MKKNMEINENDRKQVLDGEASNDSSINLMIDDETTDNGTINAATTKSWFKGTFQKTTQKLIAIGLFILIPIMANNGLLLGGSDYQMNNLDLLFHDLGTSIFLTIASMAFVKSITLLVQKGLLEPRDSRKIIHILAAPLFIFLWPLFSNSLGVRYFAAIVPFLQIVKLRLAGKGGKEGEEKEFANAISRNGDAKEALEGPLIYAIILLCSTLGFWTDSLIGIMAMLVMSTGDGLADIFGRRFGKNNKWFFAKDKSVAGSLAFVLGSTIGSVSLLSWLSFTKTITLPGVGWLALSGRVLCISVMCAIVELFPIVDDNWSVPVAAGILTSLLLA